MKVFFVLFNNRGLGVDTYEETGFMEALLAQAEKEHIEAGEEGIVFVYVSEADSGFIKVFSQKAWPVWLKGISLVVRRHFNMQEANDLALHLADGVSDNVIAFTPYVNGMLSEEEILSAHKKLCDKWGWGYVVPIEKLVEDGS